LLLSAAKHYPKSTVRRLGWLFEFTQADFDSNALAQWLEPATARPDTLLDPKSKRRGHGNYRWGIVENTVVEPDL
jgi:hypothetical protein